VALDASNLLGSQAILALFLRLAVEEGLCGFEDIQEASVVEALLDELLERDILLAELLPVLDPSLEGTLQIIIASGKWIASLFLASLLDNLDELQVLGLEYLDTVTHLCKAFLHLVVIHLLDGLDHLINWGHGDLVEVLLRETSLVQVEGGSRVEPSPVEVGTNLPKDSVV